jgi:tetratricopeptide (TPR) repeat protein
MMTLNKAIFLAKMGKPDEALATFDAAIAYKIPSIETFIWENKAVYLSQLQRLPESIDIYNSLLKSKDIKDEDKARYGEDAKCLIHIQLMYRPESR